MCVQPEPTISFYVDIRHAMFSYVINEGNSSRCLNEAMEKKKKGNSIARSTPRGVSKRQLLSWCEKLEEGENNSSKKKRKRKKGREKTSRPRVNQLHFWLFFLRLRTLAPLHLQTLTLFSFFSSPFSRFFSFLRERDRIKFSIDSFVSLLLFLSSILSFHSPSRTPLSFSLSISHLSYIPIIVKVQFILRSID